MKIRFMLLVIALAVMGNWAAADEIVVEFTPGEYTIEDVENGEIIRMEGFGQGGSPGSPMLPSKTYYIALPPDVVWDSISLSVVEKSEANLPSVYDIAAGPPALTRGDEGQDVLDWGDATNIMDGRDVDVYATDAYLPAQSAQISAFSQMRKWKFVRVDFRPMRHNPVSRQILYCDGMSVKIAFARDPNLMDPDLLADQAMDSEAAEMFLNYHSAGSWYLPNGMRPLGQGDSFDYVIITTEAIRTNVTELSNLKTHLENLGHSVLIVTEDDSYGDTSPKAGGYGSADADAIRAWLMDTYADYGIEYVLLIGDPDPNDGCVPMKMCKPYNTNTPTDYYFADLTGDWDSDGDGVYGEYGEDNVDFAADVLVGRIPFYKNAAGGPLYGNVDAIMQKVIDYENAAGDLDWRLSALLPESYTHDYVSMDGSYYGRAMETEFFHPEGFSTWEMYMTGTSGCDSHYTPDEELTGESGNPFSNRGGVTYDNWSAQAYGMMWWFGHGNWQGTGIGYGSGDCDRDQMFFYTWCEDLDNDQPALTFLGSCLNGEPEEEENMGYSLLLEGAVTVVSASRNSYGWGSSNPFDSSTDEGDLLHIGYWYGYYVAHYGGPYGQAAKALYKTKNDLRHNYHACEWQNYFGFNLYGCPHTRLVGDLNNYIRLESFEAHARGRNIVLTWETGAEIDNAGFLIYRYDGNERKAISRLIEAEGSAAAGASYRFVDSNVRPGVTYQYWLVDIDTNGTWTAHGPVRARINIEPAGVRIRQTTRDRASGNAAAIAR